MSAAPKKAASPKKGGDIVSRLTDPKLYTGAHKQRFDSDGKGRGLAGRDMGNAEKVSDLSAMTRSNLRGSTTAKSPARSPPKAAVSPKASSAAAAPASTSPKATAKKSGDIVSRLTDVKNFTGAHKARFNDDGTGKGLAGRDMGNESKVNDLSQLTRANLRAGGKTDPSSVKKSGTVSGVAPIQVKKFGTQAAVAKKIIVFQNGDQHHASVTITLTKSLSTYEKVLKAITDKLTLGTGACAKLYLCGAGDKFTKVSGLDALEDGAVYLACGPEAIVKERLPTALAAKLAA